MNKQTRRFVFGIIIASLNSYTLKNSIKRIIDLDYSWTYDYLLSSISLVSIYISAHIVIKTLK